MFPTRLRLVLALAVVVLSWQTSQTARSEKASATLAKPHVVFIIGENEYHTWETLPEFARQELEPAGIKCSFVQASPTVGDNQFVDFEQIKQADLLFVSVRRRTPPKEMMALIHQHLRAGKPLVGIRTASHAFGAQPPDTEHQGWPEFDVQILGCHYDNHYSNTAPVSLAVTAGATGHPVLAGIPTGGLQVTSSLYKSRNPASSVKVLLTGEVKGQSEVEPVAWVNTAERRRVFYTSLGSVDDFKQPFFRRLLLNGVLWALGEEKASSSKLRSSLSDSPGAIGEVSGPKKAEPGKSQPPNSKSRQAGPLSPAESLARFKVADDLQLEQVLTEPEVRQPVFLNFDERGRLWVVEYLQYPFPAGLKILSHDSVWRAVYDKVPQPPPHHIKGADKISIYADTAGDGVFRKQKTFVEGLNIATAVVRGRGGVWVLNPPYLLFYPDKNNDDIPDADPEVVLSGFGLEDTHSVVNSLRWGPDGWLYACQGSTVTASVVRPGIDREPLVHTMGQQIWRYHPETKRFEVFAEGGGNAFGCEIDAKGRIFSGHNGSNTRGFHYMQGAYLQKGFDKHGPLSNPYAFGYFPPMAHPDVDRFTHNFIIYDGGTLPERYHDKLFGVEPLQGRVVESEVTPDGSSFGTRDLGYPLTTTDAWFRPVDIKVGPDGAIYVADWYDAQVNHYRNHEGQIDKSNGRVYRLKGRGAKPLPPFDLGRLSTLQLVGLLGHSNKWFRQEALRLMADRRDRSVTPVLESMVRTNTEQLALESLWALHLCGGFNERVALTTLEHSDPFVRLWSARLLADEEKISPAIARKLAGLASMEPNVEVRAQLACSAKRLPAQDALLLLKALLARNEDSNEPRIPLLLWWAIESKCGSNRDEVLRLFEDPGFWRQPLVQQHILERIMRRFALAGTRRDLAACARLLQLSPGKEQSSKLMAGFELAFKGRSVSTLPEELVEAIAKSGGESVLLALRRGAPAAVQEALAVIASRSADEDKRLQYLEVLGEVKRDQALPLLQKLIADPEATSLHRAVLTALQQFDAPDVGAQVVDLFNSFTNEVRAAALTLLASRPAWALQLLEAVDTRRIHADAITQDAWQKIKAYSEPRLQELVRNNCGSEHAVTTAELRTRVERYAQVIRGGLGDPYEGRKLFTQSCGLCHKLFGQGAQIGPDLTPYKRDDLENMLLNVVNPSAEIREGYQNYWVATKDGRTLSGFLADKDNRVIVLRGIDGVNLVLPQDQIQEMKAAGVSLMPEGLLSALSDEQVRNLFAYLCSTQPLVGEPPRPAATTASRPAKSFE